MFVDDEKETPNIGKEDEKCYELQILSFWYSMFSLEQIMLT